MDLLHVPSRPVPLRAPQSHLSCFHVSSSMSRMFPLHSAPCDCRKYGNPRLPDPPHLHQTLRPPSCSTADVPYSKAAIFPMEVVNRNPTFGSSLLNDNFGLRTTEDDTKALDPLHLEVPCPAVASEGATENRASEEAGQSPSGQSDSPLLQSPDGATQMFNPVGAEHGESAADSQAGRTGMHRMAGRLTVGAERAGVTDWNAGTDGGRSCKSRVGVPYGSFAGV